MRRLRKGKGLRREASQPSIVGLKPAIGNLIGSGLPLRVNSGCAGQAAARQVNPNKRTPELEQTYLAIRHPLAG